MIDSLRKDSFLFSIVAIERCKQLSSRTINIKRARARFLSSGLLTGGERVSSCEERIAR